jgi:predicted SAM-dependent methyltransferase
MNIFVKRLTEILSLFNFELKALVKSAITIINVKFFSKKYIGAKLELGCGTQVKNGFIGVDIHWQVDYPFDLRLGLPFPDETISYIYSEHTLEHLYFNELKYLLTECHRVLKNDGIFSVAVPRVDIMLNAYNSSDEEFRKAVSYSYPGELKTRLDIINFMFYMDSQHRNAFDKFNLEFALNEAGFREVREREFDEKLDMHIRRNDSLFMECKK